MTVEFSPTESPFKQELVVDRNLKHEMRRQHKSFKSNKLFNSNANEPSNSPRKLSNSNRTNSHKKSVKAIDCSEQNAESPSQFERHFYSFLLNFITYIVLFVCAAKKLILRLAFFIRIQFEQMQIALIKILNKDERNQQQNDDEDYVDKCRLIKKQNSIDTNKQSTLSAPKHVCVVLNEQIENSDCLYETLRSIVDYFEPFSQVERVTFYQFNPFSSEIKERVSNDLKQQSDANNNDIVIDDDSTGKVSINDGLKNRVHRGVSKSQVAVRNKPKFELNFLNYENAGRCVLVDACKNIAKRVKSEQLKVDEITQDFIDTQILGFFFQIHTFCSLN